MKRVLVTGASGFIGRYSIAPLIARGYDVHAVSSRQIEKTSDGVSWHYADILDVPQIEYLMRQLRPTHLLHFAWYAKPGEFWRSLENFRWLEASIAMLRHFHDQGGERVVMAGTCAEYDWNFGFCSEAITPCRPVTTYGICKNALQETLRAYCAETGLNSAWGRIFFLYGPGEYPARLLASVINSLVRGEIADCTHGNQIRDFLHVEDVADAFVALLDSRAVGVVNIASGSPVSLRDVVLAAAECLGARERIRFGALPAPQGEPPLLVANCTRLYEEVGWRPRFQLRAGIEQTVRYWQERITEGCANTCN